MDLQEHGGADGGPRRSARRLGHPRPGRQGVMQAHLPVLDKHSEGRQLRYDHDVHGGPRAKTAGQDHGGREPSAERREATAEPNQSLQSLMINSAYSINNKV